MSYHISDIADLTRGYIDGYPTFTATHPNGLVVLGYPRDSFWKHMWPSWDYQLISHAPQALLFIICLNIAAILLIYIIVNSRLLKSIGPIAEGIRNLPMGEPVLVPDTGLFSEVAANINRTSQKLQSQTNDIRRKETARANWIAGVSHDIRTPLSMVIGYAEQLGHDPYFSEETRRTSAAIIRQSERIRDLISDLNLASKLEYHMQPVNLHPENTVAVVRQVVVDFINTDIDEKYPIHWNTSPDLLSCMVNMDKDLLKRAISNLLHNCMNHNENGCDIYVKVEVTDEGNCVIKVEDNGKGAADSQIMALYTNSHYMVCDTSSDRQQHGLGLLIVRQIAVVFGGSVAIDHSSFGGFSVSILLPMEIFQKSD